MKYKGRKKQTYANLNRPPLHLTAVNSGCKSNELMFMYYQLHILISF